MKKRYVIFLMVLVTAALFLYLHDSNFRFLKDKYGYGKRAGDFHKPVRNVTPGETR